MVVPKVIIAVLLLCISLGVEGQNASQSEIEGMRLVRADGSIGGSKGRLEVMYDGEWGTVCDDGWSVTGARVACRMLGFEDAICATYHSYPFGSGSYLSPILMDNVMCSGDESHLDFCDFNGWKIHNCGHYEDAGVVCGTSSSLPDFGVPENIRLIESSTTTLTIGWTAPEAPNGTSTRYRIIRSTNYRRTYYYYQTADSGEELSYTINYLQRDTVYNISIAMDVGYSECGYSYTYGNSSDDVEFRTNATRKQSNIPVRLVSSGESALNFMGRVEVSYNGTWYTVCDDYFGSYEANVICGMLNFTQGALCYVGYGRLGRGTAPILPASIDCDGSDEVLEDCSFTQGRYRYCDHSDDVGVVCRPNTVSDYLPPVENLTVTAAGPDYITLGWNSYTFPSGTYVNKRFNVRYTGDNGYTRSRTVYVYGNSQSAPSYNTYTLRYLSLGDEYNITVRAYISIYGCYSTLYGEYSDSVLATTVEIAPTAPPGEFHVIALNTSSLDVQWGLPAYGKRGGVIRGYKIFVNPANGGQEMTINITNNQTNEYVVNGLQRNTPYQISVLAYTIAGDGPRTIALTVATLNYNPLITQFGFYGNGLDRQQVYTWRYGRVHIFCGTSNVTHAPSDWYFSNGSRIGIRDRHFRVGHYPNGTAVLQIAESRSVSYCDGQTYTCVVNTTGHYETRNFTLIVGYSPPAPQTPFIISVQSTTITIGWEESSCHGGHDLASFAFRYYDTSESQSGSYYDYYYYYFPYYRNYRYITNIASDARNYTFTNLKPDTQYAISVKAISLYSTESSYSTETFITTLDPAPSRPRNVSVRLVKPMTVEVRWRTPALPNGNISHYTVYVLPYTSTGNEKVQPLTMSFPSTANAGNITLADHSITYHFRVSAAIIDDEVFNEGELSSLTQGAILYIPKPEPVTTSASPPPNPSVSPGSHSGISGATIGEIGGVTVGVLIVILLIVLIVVILLKKRKPNILLFKSFGQHKRMKDESHIFDGSHLTDTESSKDGSIFDTDESKNINTDF